MILKALTLENFKGFREPIRVEFAPLTLLFGPNNAGKSTIVQALMYAREVLEQNNCDAGQTQLGGDVVDLGGFQNLVYEQDRTRVIRMRFDLDLRGKELPRDINWVEEFGYGVGIEEFADKSKEMIFASFDQLLSSNSDIWSDIWVEIHIGCFKPAQSAAPDKPTVQRYLVGRGTNEVYAEISLRDKGTTAITKLSFGESPFGITHLRDGTPVVDSELQELFDGLIRYGNELPLRLTETAIPELGKRLEFHRSVWIHDDKKGEREGNFHNRAFEEEFLINLLTRFITSPAEHLKKALRNSVYVSAFREMPPRHYQPARSPDPKRWANGLAAWDLLLLREKAFSGQVNDWLAHEKRFNSGYVIDVRHYRELEIDEPIWAAFTAEPPKTDIDLNLVRDQLLKLPEGRRLTITDRRNGNSLAPQDLGVGFSQLIPVIVAALHTTSGVVAIEEPESNIHPAFQVVLGDLFISQVKANPGMMFLVETHSEHLVLRIMRRMRETYQGKQTGALAVSPEVVSIFYVERVDDCTLVRPMPLNDLGELVKAWPGGFFEEALREQFGDN